MERTPLLPGATRWWSAPARFAAAPLAQLRKAVLRQYTAHATWVHHHTPVGIRAQAAASPDAPAR